MLAFGTAQISQRVPEKKTTSGLWAAILKNGVRRRATLSVKLPFDSTPTKHHFNIWKGRYIYMGLDQIDLIFRFFLFLWYFAKQKQNLRQKLKK